MGLKIRNFRANVPPVNISPGWYNPDEMEMFSLEQSPAGMGDYSDIMGGAMGRPSVVNGMMAPAGPFTAGNSYGDLTGSLGYNIPKFGGDGPVAAGPSFYDKLVGYRNKDGSGSPGFGGLALAAGQGLFDAWRGMEMLKLGKDQLNFQKDSFAKNWEAQKRTVNSQLRDRQTARLASREGAPTSPYQSVGDYMNQNGIA